MKRFSSFVGDNGAAIPSILPVTEFFATRAPEIIRLYNAAKPRVSKTPRFLRRRIRSFKPYFFRAKKPKSIDSKETVSRRSLRRRRAYLASGLKRRLSLTHVWHAKRFHMGEVWGMRLPLNVNDKGSRGILRLSKRGCLVHDRSYMDCWRIGLTA